jgi:hypothetical protein
MTEPRNESTKKPDRGITREGEPAQTASVGFSRLTQAVGDCAVELATGSVRIAGEMLTDIVGAVLEPCDRITRSGQYADRSRPPERENRSGSDVGVGAAVSRAVNSVADTVTRSQERFRSALGDSGQSDQKSDEKPR